MGLPRKQDSALNAAEMFLVVDGQKYGPVTLEKARELLKTSNAPAEAVIWCAGFANWIPAIQYKDLLPHVENESAAGIPSGNHGVASGRKNVARITTIVGVAATVASLVAVLIYKLIVGASIPQWEIDTAAQNLQKNYCLSYAPCSGFRAESVSEGVTNGKAARIIKMMWVNTQMPNYKRCSYVHYVPDKEYGVISEIISSADNDETCSAKSCFGCYGQSFTEVVKKLGYTGKIPE